MSDIHKQEEWSFLTKEEEFANEIS
jgi:hypothetical protein